MHTTALLSRLLYFSSTVQAYLGHVHDVLSCCPGLVCCFCCCCCCWWDFVILNIYLFVRRTETGFRFQKQSLENTAKPNKMGVVLFLQLHVARHQINFLIIILCSSAILIIYMYMLCLGLESRDHFYTILYHSVKRYRKIFKL